jgi:hypothetical protein
MAHPSLFAVLAKELKIPMENRPPRNTVPKRPFKRIELTTIFAAKRRVVDHIDAPTVISYRTKVVKNKRSTFAVEPLEFLRRLVMPAYWQKVASGPLA